MDSLLKGVFVIRINCKNVQEKPVLMGLLCIGLPEPIERNPCNCVRLSPGGGGGGVLP